MFVRRLTKASRTSGATALRRAAPPAEVGCFPRPPRTIESLFLPFCTEGLSVSSSSSSPEPPKTFPSTLSASDEAEAVASLSASAATSSSGALAPAPRIPGESEEDREARLIAEEDAAFARARTALAATTTGPAAVAGSDATARDRSDVQKFFYPDKESLPDDLEMPIWDHLEELRERVVLSALAAVAAVGVCFLFAKDLVVFLELPVLDKGVRFLQLSPGEFFFTTLKVAGYSGLLVAVPTVFYEVVAYVVPGLTRDERKFLGPVLLASTILFVAGLAFAYVALAPAALNFFVSFADGAVESLWSIDQYFEFVLLLMLSTGLSFQVPVVQVMLGQLGLVTSDQMFRQWRYVVVGATVAAAVLTPSTDPFTQALLAVPLIALYMGGAFGVRLLEQGREVKA